MDESDRPLADHGRMLSPMLTSQFHAGQRPPNYGLKLPPEFYTPEEIAALMRACGRGPGGDRKRAMIALQARSGLRVGELLALKLKDIDFALGAVTVMNGKGGKRRMVPLDPTTAAVLTVWISGARAKLDLPRGRPLFCTYERGNSGEPVRYQHYETALKRAGRKAGIEKRIHSHGLRHSCLFQLLLEGRDILLIQLIAGHDDLGTTQRYLNHRFPLQMIRELQSRAWPDAMLAGVPEPVLAAA